VRFGDQLLRYVLAVVLGWAAVQTLMSMPAHMPRILVLAIAGLELVGCVLFALPKVAYTGGWLLFAAIIAAIILHVLHRQYGVENLIIYAAATFAVVTKLRS